MQTDHAEVVSLKTSDFHYVLPESLIASHPLAERAASRMMVVDRATGKIEHRKFSDFPDYIKDEDLVVLNDTRVIPARVFSDDHLIELLCVDRHSATEWQCLVKPGKKMKVGREVVVGGVVGTVTEILDNGDRLIQWSCELDLEEHGQLALPHYMGRENEETDHERYQTVYAKHDGAIAAPTAGLHFTPEMLSAINHDFLTLHVGVGTFRPVSVESLTDHRMHSERYRITSETAKRINQAARVVAVGTTVTRVLEAISSANEGQIPRADHQGETSIFIHPPYQFQKVDSLLTNFHLPESTLIMLVSAFAGHSLTMKAYNAAVAEKYRFYSYGDCMLII